MGAIAGLALAIVFTWRLARSPGGPQRRQPKRQAPTTSSSVQSNQSNATVTPSGVASQPEDFRAQNVVDEFFQPVKVSCNCNFIIAFVMNIEHMNLYSFFLVDMFMTNVLLVFFFP